MLYQRATVVEINDRTISLEVERQSTCGQCQLKKGCGTGLLAEHVGKRFSRIVIDKTTEVTPSQQVNLAIPEQSLLQGAALMYLLPLLSMLLFAVVARWLGFNSIAEIILGLLGLSCGFAVVRKFIESRKVGFKAKLVEEKE